MQLSFQTIPDAITLFFLLATASYYVLLFVKRPQGKKERDFKSITIAVPAHNEEQYIEACVRSIIAADFPGEKEIIVFDDGSTDRTSEIAKAIDGIELVRTDHRGKSLNINSAIARAKGELFAIVDGDGEIAKDAIVEMMKELERERVAGASCPIFIKNRTTHIIPWLHIEILHGALMRLIMSKIDANIVTSGQFCMFRTDALREVGGFNTGTFSEDMDISVRLIRRGYRVGFSETARCWTNMPSDFKWLLGQRYRWCRGNLNVILSHQRLNTSWIDLYTFPLILFGYFQAVIMGGISLTKLTIGYWNLYACHGVFFGPEVTAYLLNWLSILGLMSWSIRFFAGQVPVTAVTVCGVLAGLLTYPLYIYAIWRFDRRFDVYHIVPLLFMAPYWWTVGLIQLASVGVFFDRRQRNIWAKNDRSLSVDPATLKAYDAIENPVLANVAAPSKERELVSKL